VKREIHVGIVDPKVSAEHRSERVTKIAQRRLGARSEHLLGHDHAERPSVLQPVQAMDAGGVVTNARWRVLGHLDLGNEIALRRIPTRELDARRLADDAAPSVTPNQILRAQRLGIGQCDVDAVVVLRETCHGASVMSPHWKLGDPGTHDALELVLPDRECVGVARREVTHVQHRRADHRRLSRLTLGEKPVGHPPLIQHLDRACVDTAGPRADEVMI
jgi:hypothetical protein